MFRSVSETSQGASTPRTAPTPAEGRAAPLDAWENLPPSPPPYPGPSTPGAAPLAALQAPESTPYNVGFNIGDRIRGKIPRAWLAREPESRLARILRHEEACAVDEAGHFFLDDIQPEDWPDIERWLAKRMAPETATASLRMTASQYELRHLQMALSRAATDPCQGELRDSVTVGAAPSINFKFGNAAARLLTRGQLEARVGFAVHPGSSRIRSARLIVDDQGQVIWEITRPFKKIREFYEVSARLGEDAEEVPLVCLPVAHADAMERFQLKSPDARLLDSLSAVYNADASLCIRINVMEGPEQVPKAEEAEPAPVATLAVGDGAALRRKARLSDFFGRVRDRLK